MPRTKQRKPKANSAAVDTAVREFNRLMQLRIHTLERNQKALIEKYEVSCQVSLSRYPQEIQNMTLRELLAPPEPPEPSPPRKEILVPKTPRHAKTSTAAGSASISRQTGRTTAKKIKRTTAASDDGYQSESTNSQVSKTSSMILGHHQQQQQQSVVQTGKKRQRSSSRGRENQRSSSRGRTTRLTNAMSQTKQKELLQTPSNRPQNTFVITPKIKPNSNVNVLRKPKDGEMVFSTQGSPLIVSTTVNERTANINVPLQNGKVVSLLPFHETSLTENLPLDEETKHQLKILQSHLAKVLN